MAKKKYHKGDLISSEKFIFLEEVAPRPYSNGKSAYRQALLECPICGKKFVSRLYLLEQDQFTDVPCYCRDYKQEEIVDLDEVLYYKCD